MKELTEEQRQQIEAVHNSRQDKISILSIEAAVLFLLIGTLVPMPGWVSMVMYASAALSGMMAVVRRWQILLRKKTSKAVSFPWKLFLFQGVFAALCIVFRGNQAVVSAVCLVLVAAHAYLAYSALRNS